MRLDTAGFEPVTEVSTDDRSRIVLTKAGVHGSERFLISRRASGEILLTPLASIPKRELILWENEALRQSLQRGISQAEAGEVKPATGLLDELESL